MKLYVSNYQIIATNHHHVISEIGMKNPVGFLPTEIDTKVSCEFVPILEDGESVDDMMALLGKWITGQQVVMVKAKEVPRCFYCGTLNSARTDKCQYCGGEMR